VAKRSQFDNLAASNLQQAIQLEDTLRAVLAAERRGVRR
jgi:hypothetical protein